MRKTVPDLASSECPMEKIINHLKNSSLSLRIILGLIPGLFTGLFLGEKAIHLQWIADAWIRLMQMSVLPYVMMSLIVGLGQMSAPLARKLAYCRIGNPERSRRSDDLQFPHSRTTAVSAIRSIRRMAGWSDHQGTKRSARVNHSEPVSSGQA